MADYFRPGIFIREEQPALRSIAGVSTGILGIVLVAKKGPIGKPVLVNSWDEFVSKFGGLWGQTYGPQAVYQFLIDGGRKVYVVRTCHYNEDGEPTALESSVSYTKAGNTLVIKASSPGTWGNKLKVKFNRQFTVFTSLKDDVSAGDSSFIPVSASKIKSGDVLFVGSGSTTITAKVDEDTFTVSSTSGMEVGMAVIFGDLANNEVRKITAIEGNDITVDASVSGDYLNKPLYFGEVVEVQNVEDGIVNIYDSFVYDHSANQPIVSILTKIEIYEGKFLVETVENVSFSSHSKDYIFNLVFKNVVFEGAFNLDFVSITGQTFMLTGGKDGLDGLTQDDFTGPDLKGKQAGLYAFDLIEELALLCMPDIHLCPNPEISIKRAIAYCEGRKDMFFVFSSPKGKTKGGVSDTNSVQYWFETNGFNSSYSACYYPWLKCIDEDGNFYFAPPDGAVLNLYVRIDNTRTVAKAPAGYLYPLYGVYGVETEITDVEQESLFPRINCIRRFPGAGIVVWGARTTSMDDAWKYITERRTFIYAAKSLMIGLRWVVFEPNTEDLWLRVSASTMAFCLSMFRAGMLKGKTPSEAFYVKCDASVNPPEDIEKGIFRVKVGLAVAKPAEFVEIVLAQHKDWVKIE
jgi:phage tail sheath protein FI